MYDLLLDGTVTVALAARDRSMRQQGAVLVIIEDDAGMWHAVWVDDCAEQVRASDIEGTGEEASAFMQDLTNHYDGAATKLAIAVLGTVIIGWEPLAPGQFQVAVIRRSRDEQHKTSFGDILTFESQVRVHGVAKELIKASPIIVD